MFSVKWLRRFHNISRNYMEAWDNVWLFYIFYGGLFSLTAVSLLVTLSFLWLWLNLSIKDRSYLWPISSYVTLPRVFGHLLYLRTGNKKVFVANFKIFLQLQLLSERLLFARTDLHKNGGLKIKWTIIGTTTSGASFTSFGILLTYRSEE